MLSTAIKNRAVCATAAIIIACAVGSAEEVNGPPGCHLWASGEGEAKPVIFGDPVKVPAFTIRVVEMGTGRDVPVDYVLLHYTWRWLQYPYSEHAWGAWSDASDIVRCIPSPSQPIFSAPEFEVHPRGWYNGKYARWPWPHRPSFQQIEVAVIAKSGQSPHIFLKKSDFPRFSTSTIVIRVAPKTPNDPPFIVEFRPKTGLPETCLLNPPRRHAPGSERHARRKSAMLVGRHRSNSVGP
jgi:hypothetical protein